MKKFLISAAFGVATFLATDFSASACPHRGCSRPSYQSVPYVTTNAPQTATPTGTVIYVQNTNVISTAPNGITSSPGTNGAVNPGTKPGTNGSVNPGTNPGANGGVKPGNGNNPTVEWDLPAEEKARIREAAKSVGTPKPVIIRTNGGRQ